MPAHCSIRPASHSFYVLMVDYGRDVTKVRGLEAVVNPEHTRRAIVDQARDILSEGRNEIAFVKFVDGDDIFDVTQEILDAAELEAAE